MTGTAKTYGTLAEATAARGITRLRHFTTDRGALGIIATGQLRSRALLTTDNYLEHIYLPNCDVRRDPAWLNYVNLSVTEINASFFAICSGKPAWHADMDGFWVIVDLVPDLVWDKGVTFVNTNNRYTGARRGVNLAGFEEMFAPTVRPWYSAPTISRPAALASNLTTDQQAEVLYPNFVPSDRIDRLIVRESEHAATLEGQLRVFRNINPASIDVVVDPSAFQPSRA